MIQILFSIDPADWDAVRGDFSPHFPSIHMNDLNGLTLVTLEATGVEAKQLVYKHPKAKVVFPGPNGSLDQSHADELGKSKKFAKTHKKGDPMRDALSTIFAASGNDAHDPDYH